MYILLELTLWENDAPNSKQAFQELYKSWPSRKTGWLIKCLVGSGCHLLDYL